MREVRYRTPSGIEVSRVTSALQYRHRLHRFLRELDKYRGVYLSSGYEYPGRYDARWDILSLRPPLELISFQREVTFHPLNERGAAINRLLANVLRDHPHWDDFREEDGALYGTLKPMPRLFPEEERSKQPSVFSILRTLSREFRNENDDKLAFMGAFGYDLLFQFEPISLRLPREGHKDLQLFLCDDIIYMDHERQRIERFTWEFERDGVTTRGLARSGDCIPEAPRR
jgi:anthranilate synthase